MHVAGAVGALRVDHRDVRPVRRNGGELFAGERAGDALDLGIHLRQVAADIAAEHRAGQARGARLVGVGHGGVRMLLDFELVRPAVLDRVAETMQRADARIAAPGKHQLVGAAHADELVVDQVRRHADQRQVLAALADDLVAGGMGNEMGEAFHRHRVAVADGGLDGFGERRNTRHARLLPGCGTVFTAGHRQGQMAEMGASLSSNEWQPCWAQQPIFTIHAELADIMNLGRTPLGERRVIGILGGSVRGRSSRAAFCPAAPIGRSSAATAPPISRRATPSRPMPARASWSSSDGLRHGPPEVMERLARGDSVDPALYYFRTVMRFETADPAVDWLNRILALARGQREARAVRLDVYEVE